MIRLDDGVSSPVRISIPKAEPGDRVAVLSPAFAAPARGILATIGGDGQIAVADRMPRVTDLAGAILLLETSEELPSADTVMRWVRGLGERGVLEVVAGVLVARPVVSELDSPVPSARERTRLREAQRDTIIEQVHRYNPHAVMCVGVPFGHTRPQWIVPCGGATVTECRPMFPQTVQF